METLTENITFRNKTISRTHVAHSTPSLIFRSKHNPFQFAKNPLVWAAMTWLAVFAMLIVDVLYR
jgi:hypothetical protein